MSVRNQNHAVFCTTVISLLFFIVLSAHLYAASTADKLNSWQAQVGTKSHSITGLPARVGATFEDALGVVESAVLKGKVKTLELSAKKTRGSRAALKLSTWGKRTVTAPWDEYWLFFSDDAPLANWAHPCRYIFVSPDLSSIAVQEALTPLEFQPTEANTARENAELEVIIPFVPPTSRQPTQKKTAPITPSHQSTRSTEDEVSNCYAVIISGGCNLANNHIRYWGDAAFMYSTLTLTYGYPKTNIYALISDGLNTDVDRSDNSNSPFDLDGDGVEDTYADASATSVSNVLIHLQSILTTNDQLFIFTTDHGAPSTGNTDDGNVELNLWNEEIFRDADMEMLTTNIPCPILFAMEQCYSGGFLDNLDQSNRVIATAAYYNESSYAGDTFPDYDQWCYHWIAAMRGYYPTTAAQTPWINGEICDADANDDGYVSFLEADRYAYAHKYSMDNPMYQENPTHLGKQVFLSQPVGALGMDQYLFDRIATPQATNIPFSMRITACNVRGEVVTNSPETALLQGMADDINPGCVVGNQDLHWNYPLLTYYHDARTQVIYPTNLLGGTRTLTNLALYVISLPGQELSNWTIRMKHTLLETYPANPEWETNDWSVVYQGNETNHTVGWVNFPFTNSFEYNGTNSLMIDFSFNNDSYTESGVCRASTSEVPRTIIYESDSYDGDPLEWGGTNPPPVLSYYYPNLRFGPPPIPVYPEITPTNITGFVDGVWTGEVRVLETTTNMWLCIIGTNENWSGESRAFAVKDYRFVLNTIQTVPDSGDTILRWESHSNYTYRVLASTNLQDEFTLLATNLPATPPLNTYTDTTPVINHRFYAIGEEE